VDHGADRRAGHRQDHRGRGPHPLADQSDRRLRIALTAPTGKAAARLQEAVRTALAEPRFADHATAVGDPTAQTLHRLLGWKRGSRNRFRHDRRNRLPHDVIIVDETSMVSLTMMARLVEAVRADCRLILVGDPDQLASVEAGAVLADLVDGLARREPATVASLRESHRFGRQINDLAEAVGRRRRPALTLLTAGGSTSSCSTPTTRPPAALRAPGRPRPGTRAEAVWRRRRAVAVLDQHRLLAPIATDPGVSATEPRGRAGLAEHTGLPIGGGCQEWYAGRPLLLTSNDTASTSSTATRVVVADGDGVRAAIATPHGPRCCPPRVTDVDTMHAMTVHKSQGSQAAEVTVLLPPDESPADSRALHTALTRAEEKVTVVATHDAVRLAVGRPPTGRAVSPTGSPTRRTTKPERHAPPLVSSTCCCFASSCPTCLGHWVGWRARSARRGDIEAIEIVEKRYDGTAVDDVLEMVDGAMPDSVVRPASPSRA
jgi:exodeoxyribonuclease V alpha subunit